MRQIRVVAIAGVAGYATGVQVIAGSVNMTAGVGRGQGEGDHVGSVK